METATPTPTLKPNEATKFVDWDYTSRQQAPRIYVWIEESILDNLRNRRSRPVDAYRAAAAKACEVLGVKFDRLTWSQKAGCSCGCSPGFIVREPVGFSRRDLHVHVSA